MSRVNKKSLAVDPTNQDEIDELWSVVEDPGKVSGRRGVAIHASYATIEVDDEELTRLRRNMTHQSLKS